MTSRLINAVLMSAALASLPVVGSAAQPSLLHGCVQAFMSRLAAGSAHPMKLRETREIDGGAMQLGSPEVLVLTARDAHSDQPIAHALCTTDRHGLVVLSSDSLAQP